MKVGILAGGRGTRLGNSPALPPKPLVEIGGKPILWHVLMQFRHQGFDLEGERVRSFAEKPALDDLWVNGAYFVMEPGIFARLSAEGCDLERDVMPALALQGELAAFRHEGFWDCMDTSADRERLQALWQCGDAPWAPWQKAA
jgi:NDP-sugar pyrophosphorylase family protein